MHLAIDLSSNGILIGEPGKVDSIKQSMRFSNLTDLAIKEDLDQFFRDQNIRMSELSECTISWSCMRTTLVPGNIFAASSPLSIFSLCFGKNFESNSIDYNRIPEQGIVNIFEIPLWVKSYFVLKFPRSIIQQEGSLIIRGLFGTGTFKLRALLSIHETYFGLTIVKENKLQFYSTFEYQNSDDIIYHFIFVLQQKEWFGSEIQIEICDGVGSSSDLTEETNEKLKKFKEFQDKSIHTGTNFLINSHKFCV
jgi:hypothetical protein